MHRLQGRTPPLFSLAALLHDGGHGLKVVYEPIRAGGHRAAHLRVGRCRPDAQANKQNKKDVGLWGVNIRPTDRPFDRPTQVQADKPTETVRYTRTERLASARHRLFLQTLPFCAHHDAAEADEGVCCARPLGLHVRRAVAHHHHVRIPVGKTPPQSRHTRPAPEEARNISTRKKKREKKEKKKELNGAGGYLYLFSFVAKRVF